MKSNGPLLAAIAVVMAAAASYIAAVIGGAFS